MTLRFVNLIAARPNAYRETGERVRGACAAAMAIQLPVAISEHNISPIRGEGVKSMTLKDLFLLLCKGRGRGRRCRVCK
jgi:hypothetical protein